MRFILLVMRIKLLSTGNHSRVQRVRLFANRFDHDGLVHFVGNDFSDNNLAAGAPFLLGCFGHGYFFSVLRAPASSCSRRIVFTRAMSLRKPRIFLRLSVCPIFIWNFNLKSWSARSRSWWRSSTSVKFRILSVFIIDSQFLQCAVSRLTNAVRKGSLWDARRIASAASVGVTPSISNKIFP